MSLDILEQQKVIYNGIINLFRIKASIANFLNRSDLTTEIQDDFIKLTEADFNAKLRIRQMEQQDDITIDAEQVTVPTGFLAVRSFYITIIS